MQNNNFICDQKCVSLQLTIEILRLIAILKINGLTAL